MSNDYAAFIARPPADPTIGDRTRVRITPAELGGGALVGETLWLNNGGEGPSWAVAISYGGDGALMYVHWADLVRADAPWPTKLVAASPLSEEKGAESGE